MGWASRLSRPVSLEAKVIAMARAIRTEAQLDAAVTSASLRATTEAQRDVIEAFLRKHSQIPPEHGRLS